MEDCEFTTCTNDGIHAVRKGGVAGDGPVRHVCALCLHRVPDEWLVINLKQPIDHDRELGVV